MNEGTKDPLKRDPTNLILKRQQVVVKQDRSGGQRVILRKYPVVGLLVATNIRNGIP